MEEQEFEEMTSKEIARFIQLQAEEGKRHRKLSQH